MRISFSGHSLPRRAHPSIARALSHRLETSPRRGLLPRCATPCTSPVQHHTAKNRIRLGVTRPEENQLQKRASSQLPMSSRAEPELCSMRPFSGNPSTVHTPAAPRGRVCAPHLSSASDQRHRTSRLRPNSPPHPRPPLPAGVRRPHRLTRTSNTGRRTSRGWSRTLPSRKESRSAHGSPHRSPPTAGRATTQPSRAAGPVASATSSAWHPLDSLGVLGRAQDATGRVLCRASRESSSLRSPEGAVGWGSIMSNHRTAGRSTTGTARKLHAGRWALQLMSYVPCARKYPRRSRIFSISCLCI